ncbi:MAG: phosphohistidine phosphatase SixA [Candidatus Makaraimicrobium thalassicum]|nr:MAG: phosphohistidine phosphatase SixA [Candidatus Omnitrophota bacterium]
MKIYLVQHGVALPEEQDPRKPLSRDGRDETRKTARFLKKKKIKVDRVWHSKKARAVETAEIISRAVGHKEMSQRDDLNPNDPVEKFLEEVERFNADLMIVGHLPFLRKLASLFLTGSDSPDLISFKNSGVVCLEYRETWKLAWFVTPDLL